MIKNLKYLYTIDITSLLKYRSNIDLSDKDFIEASYNDMTSVQCIGSVGVENLGIEGDYILWGCHIMNKLFCYNIREFPLENFKDEKQCEQEIPVFLSTNDKKLAASIKIKI